MTDRYDDFNLDLELARGTDEQPGPTDREYADVEVDYQPTGTLQLDTRPITPEEVKALRHQTNRVRTSGQIDYLTIEAMAERIGCPKSTYTLWENAHNDQLNGLLGALIRLHFAQQVQFEWKPCPPDLVRALAWSVGGYEKLAEEMDRTESACTEWAMKRQGTGTRGGAGPICRYLVQDMGLEPLEEWPGGPNTSLEPHEVREIRKVYHGSDLGYTRTGRKLGYSKRQVRNAIKKYDHVE